MTNIKKQKNIKKHKKILIISIIIVVIITTIIILKKGKYEPCTWPFLTVKEAIICKKTIDRFWGYSINCRDMNQTEEERDLCKRAKKAEYPYITY